MYYLPDNIYQQLLAFLGSEVDPDQPGTSTAFSSYFENENGMWHCTNYDAYMQWLSGLIEDGDYGLFVAWDQNMLAQSGQGGTFKINF